MCVSGEGLHGLTVERPPEHPARLSCAHSSLNSQPRPPGAGSCTARPSGLDTRVTWHLRAAQPPRVFYRRNALSMQPQVQVQNRGSPSLSPAPPLLPRKGPGAAGPGGGGRPGRRWARGSGEAVLSHGAPLAHRSPGPAWRTAEGAACPTRSRGWSSKRRCGCGHRGPPGPAPREAQRAQGCGRRGAGSGAGGSAAHSALRCGSASRAVRSRAAAAASTPRSHSVHLRTSPSSGAPGSSSSYSTSS